MNHKLLILLLTTLIIIPLAAGDNITLVSEIHGAGDPNYLNQIRSIEKVGDYVFTVSISDRSLSSFDVSDPYNPICLDSIYIDLDYPCDIAISGNYAYVPFYGLTVNAFSVFDISNPSAMSHVTTLSGLNAPNYLDGPLCVEVSGNYLYVVSSRADRLGIFDISNPAAPSFTGLISGAGAPNYLEEPLGVEVIGNYAYLSVFGDYAFTIIDVSTPSSPTHAGTYTSISNMRVGGVPSKPKIKGNYAYVPVVSNDCITIIDISNPLSPSYHGIISGSGAPNYLYNVVNLDISGDYLYAVSRNSDSLTMFDISNVDSPINVGSITGEGSPNYLSGTHDVMTDGDYIYVASGLDDALTIFEYDPSTPTPTPEPTSTPIIAPPPIIPTEVPTPSIVEDAELTIIEESIEKLNELSILLTEFIGKGLTWTFLLATYIGTIASHLLMKGKEENEEPVLFDILLFGTIGWVLLLLINTTEYIAIVTTSFVLNALIFGIAGFVLYTILDLVISKE